MAPSLWILPRLGVGCFDVLAFQSTSEVPKEVQYFKSRYKFTIFYKRRELKRKKIWLLLQNLPNSAPKPHKSVLESTKNVSRTDKNNTYVFQKYYLSITFIMNYIKKVLLFICLSIKFLLHNALEYYSVLISIDLHKVIDYSVIYLIKQIKIGGKIICIYLMVLYLLLNVQSTTSS